MILQVITPQKESFDLHVNFPKDYLGKQVHCLFYVEEEAKNVSVSAPSNKKPSDYFGILTQKEGEKFHQHIQEMRSEWDRSI